MDNQTPPADRRSYQLELVEDLERILSRRRHGLADGHLHGHEIEVREAHRAVAALRDAVREGRVTAEVLRHVRSTGCALHLAQPRSFVEVIELLERETGA